MLYDLCELTSGCGVRGLVSWGLFVPGLFVFVPASGRRSGLVCAGAVCVCRHQVVGRGLFVPGLSVAEFVCW